ncbi:hypothetical protein TNCV_1839211 [Trichonephila clavipes]|nr:hypothetical protein TNCV_1839211 [Trichonephila clavipes]
MLHNLHKSKKVKKVKKQKKVQKGLVLFEIQSNRDVGRRDELGITQVALWKYLLSLAKCESFYMAARKARESSLVFPRHTLECASWISSEVPGMFLGGVLPG